MEERRKYEQPCINACRDEKDPRYRLCKNCDLHVPKCNGKNYIPRAKEELEVY